MKILLQIAALALVVTGHAQGTSEAVLSFATPISGSINGTAGWTFQPVSSISVTGLGAFNYVVMNQGPIQVALWDSGGNLLASNTITTSSGLTNVTRYESVTPVQLSPGITYYLGAYSGSGSMLLSAVTPDFGSVSLSPDIHLRGTAQNTGGFGFPTANAGPDGAMYLGLNFRYQFIPEP